MSECFSDWKSTAIAASAAIVVRESMLVLKPLGLESGIGCFVVILPGALVAFPASDHVFERYHVPNLWSFGLS